MAGYWQFDVIQPSNAFLAGLCCGLMPGGVYGAQSSVTADVPSAHCLPGMHVFSRLRQAPSLLALSV